MDGHLQPSLVPGRVRDVMMTMLNSPSARSSACIKRRQFSSGPARNWQLVSVVIAMRIYDHTELHVPLTLRTTLVQVMLRRSTRPFDPSALLTGTKASRSPDHFQHFAWKARILRKLLEGATLESGRNTLPWQSILAPLILKRWCAMRSSINLAPFQPHSAWRMSPAWLTSSSRSASFHGGKPQVSTD